MNQVISKKAFEIDRLNLSYQKGAEKVKVLSDTTFSIDQGKFIVLVGPSGCGKSSLLMTMAGLQQPSSGSIICNNRELNSPDPDRVGVVFQDSNLFPWMTAIDNVAFPLMLKHHPKADRLEKARNALELVGLAGNELRYPRELSGGMRQRVSIARGLVQDPPVLMMDEPFAALDEQTRLEMGDELLRIWSRTKKTIVFVTHGLSEAVYLADEIYVMAARPGRIVEQIQVDLPRPRTFETMSMPLFNEIRDHIWSKIRKA
ncbi:TPA: ABC transporter ATP-binding protein [Klebsiella pneumoniae]|nr:ABC transporter ATP-binding protein [Klebsiella pneumoniae]STX14726.1 nitrate/sulfonate/bicarbonate ABC transporter ATPase [Klebsiella pneumoniae]HCI6085734.1 ABC transporter ATP-binding protein [Klebsiella pneumoniae]